MHPEMRDAIGKLRQRLQTLSDNHTNVAALMNFLGALQEILLLVETMLPPAPAAADAPPKA